VDTITSGDVIIVAHRPGACLHDGTAGGPARKDKAAAELAPVLSATADLAMFTHGFKIALKQDLGGLRQPHHVDQVPAATRERLIMARDMLRLKAGLLTAPEARIVYQGGEVTLLGDPSCLKKLSAAEFSGWKFR
jgi:hypothetical protein